MAERINSLAWTRDGTAVIYDATGPTSNFGFWRVTIDGNHAPERIETGGDPGDASCRAIARSAGVHTQYRSTMTFIDSKQVVGFNW